MPTPMIDHSSLGGSFSPDCSFSGVVGGLRLSTHQVCNRTDLDDMEAMLKPRRDQASPVTVLVFNGQRLHFASFDLHAPKYISPVISALLMWTLADVRSVGRCRPRGITASGII